MKFPFRIHRRLVRRAALGLAVAAVVVPTAQALPGDKLSAELDTAALPCTPTCPSFDTASNLPDDAAIHGPGAASIVTIPESVSGRQFGPTSAGIVADTVKPMPIKGGFVLRQAQPAGASSDVTRRRDRRRPRDRPRRRTRGRRGRLWASAAGGAVSRTPEQVLPRKRRAGSPGPPVAAESGRFSGPSSVPAQRLRRRLTQCGCGAR